MAKHYFWNKDTAKIQRTDVLKVGSMAGFWSLQRGKVIMTCPLCTNLCKVLPEGAGGGSVVVAKCTNDPCEFHESVDLIGV